MASIQEVIELVDGASPKLAIIADAAHGAHTSIEETQRATNKLKETMNGTSGAIAKMTGSFKSMVGQFALGNIAANVITTIGEKLMELPGKMIAASDAYSGMTARLKLVAGSAEQAADMNDRIYASAMRARGSYEGMLGNVAKIAMTAKEGFPDPNEVIPFVEGIQKLFTIGGTGLEEQKNAMLQLTQALGSGKLQGDEFRSIAEAAPLIEQMIAKEMGVTQGELKNLGSQGAITAEIIKNAIFNNMDEINDKFAQMPQTWSQIMQNMGNTATMAFAPLFKTISDLANSDGIKNFVSNLSTGLYAAGTALAWLVTGMTQFGSVAFSVGAYIGDWLAAGFVVAGTALEALAPAIIGVLGLYAGYQALLLVNWLEVNGAMMLHAAIQSIVAARTMVMTALTAAWALVTKGMAAAQMALNVVLLANPIGLIIAAVVAVIGIFLAWRASTIGLRGAVAEAFGTMARIVQSCVDGMIGAVNGLIKLLNKAAEGINNTFGTKISAVAEIGYTEGNWGEKIENGTNNLNFSKLGDLLPKAPSIDDVGGGSYGGGASAGALDDIAGSSKDTAGNTGRIADSIDALDEDLRYLREVAEQEAINRYTTAAVTVELGGVTNQISSDMDIDGVVDRLTAGIRDGMVNAAQEVHP